MIIRATLPLALASFALSSFTGCTGDDGPAGDGEDESTGISSLPESGDGDGDGDGDATGDGDGDGDGPDCGSVSITPEYTPPNIMLVLDASGSMIANSWDHDLDMNTPTVTRWFSLYNVVEAILTQFGPSMNAGLQRFPAEAASNSYGPNACTVGATPEVDIALDNGTAILAAIPGAMPAAGEIEGGTPATSGINSAVTHLMEKSAEVPRYILFVTDGAANCDPTIDLPPGMALNTALMENYDETLEPTVQAAFDDAGITTFVVGIDIVNMIVNAGTDGAPEANPFERLNDIALAGGAPKNMGMDAEKFFNTTNQDELLLALSGIIDEITECTIDLSMTDEGVPEPIQIPYVTFTSNGELVPFVEDCANEDGWAWLEVGVIMTFCGSYCDDFKSGGATFDGTYGCPPAG